MKRTYLVAGLILALALALAVNELLSRGTAADPVSPAEISGGPLEAAPVDAGRIEERREPAEAPPLPAEPDALPQEGPAEPEPGDLLRGPLLTGRVMAPDGTPVHQAVVNVRFGDEAWLWEEWVPHRDRRLRMTDAEGRFEIPVGRSGEALVSAMKLGVGTGSIGPLPIEASGDTALPDLFLEGSGEIAGVVVYPDGSAVREMEVYAVDVAVSDELPVDTFNTEEAPIGLLEGAKGLPYGWDVTGVDGSFRIGGLAPGTYGFRLDDWFSRDPMEQRPVGTRDVRLVFDGYRLEILVRDEAGVPVPRADSSWTITTPEGRSRGGASDIRDGSKWRRIAPGLVSVCVEAGAKMDWRSLVVPEGQYESRMVLTPRALELSRLVLSITGPEGEPVGDIETVLFLESTDIPVRFASLAAVEDRPGAYWMDAPAGRFDLRLDPQHLFYSTLELEGLVVDPERVDPIPIRLEKGGRLRLTARLTDSQEEMPLRVARIWLDGQELRYRTGFIDPRWPETHSGSSTNLLATGIPFTTGFEPLAPGSYRFELAVEGYAPAAKDFRILAGEITEVEVWLSPE